MGKWQIIPLVSMKNCFSKRKLIASMLRICALYFARQTLHGCIFLPYSGVWSATQDEIENGEMMDFSSTVYSCKCYTASFSSVLAMCTASAVLLQIIAGKYRENRERGIFSRRLRFTQTE